MDALAIVRDVPGVQSMGLLAGRSILLVDDDADTPELALAILSAAGAAVTVASNATDAYAAVSSQRFDVLLSDIAMPKLSGNDLITIIRKAEKTEHLTAVALSAHARDQDREEALEAGFDGRLTKPIAPQDLVQSIVEILERRAT